ncbi:glycyl-radical enzyme activating protein [Chloroflexota bacterium]
MAIVFNIQRFSIQDGPGIRTTVFIKGCPLQCPWCSNPESQNAFPEVGHRNLLCNKCGRCVEVCEVHAISLTDNGVEINRETCTGCGKCAEVCVPEALKFYGEEMSVEEVFQEVVRDEPFYQNSGGGVTVGGGEPLSQPDFVAALLKRCRDAGIHTCIDTCGYAAPSAWKKVLPYTNLVLFDLKLIDPSAHRKVTGKSNEKILRSLKLVVEAGVPAIIRIPLIPGINDSKENIANTARYVAGLNGLREVNLLPYHRFGESKYVMLDRTYRLSELTSPNQSQLEELCDVVKSFDLDCEVVI